MDNPKVVKSEYQNFPCFIDTFKGNINVCSIVKCNNHSINITLFYFFFTPLVNSDKREMMGETEMKDQNATKVWIWTRSPITFTVLRCHPRKAHSEPRNIPMLRSWWAFQCSILKAEEQGKNVVLNATGSIHMSSSWDPVLSFSLSGHQNKGFPLVHWGPSAPKSVSNIKSRMTTHLTLSAMVIRVMVWGGGASLEHRGEVALHAHPTRHAWHDLQHSSAHARSRRKPAGS